MIGCTIFENLHLIFAQLDTNIYLSLVFIMAHLNLSCEKIVCVFLTKKLNFKNHLLVNLEFNMFLHRHVWSMINQMDYQKALINCQYKVIFNNSMTRVKWINKSSRSKITECPKSTKNDSINRAWIGISILYLNQTYFKILFSFFQEWCQLFFSPFWKVGEGW